MKSDDPDVTTSVLARYLSGESDAAESAVVRAWATADPSHQSELDALATYWNQAPVPEFDADGAVWARIATQMGAPASRPALSVHHTHSPAIRESEATDSRWLPSVRRSGWMKAAAVLVVVGGGAAALRTGAGSGPNPSVASVRMQHVATRPGQRVEISLSDGSQVVLGPASRMSYPSEFIGDREIELSGEAYFEVAHDPDRRFAVRTTRAVTRNIGTKFGVSAYEDSRSTRVVVREGSVAVTPRHPSDAAVASRRPAPAAVLKHGDLARVGSDGALAVEHGVDVEAHLAWTSGRLVFTSTPLRDAIAQMNRWYDADIRIGDARIADYPVTATFGVESLSQAIGIIAAATDLRVERDAATITLLRR
jgi:ferric-dicitrate binding protein FerR (iron transport regulator)